MTNSISAMQQQVLDILGKDALVSKGAKITLAGRLSVNIYLNVNAKCNLVSIDCNTDGTFNVCFCNATKHTFTIIEADCFSAESIKAAFEKSTGISLS